MVHARTRFVKGFPDVALLTTVFWVPLESYPEVNDAGYRDS